MNELDRMIASRQDPDRDGLFELSPHDRTPGSDEVLRARRQQFLLMCVVAELLGFEDPTKMRVSDVLDRLQNRRYARAFLGAT